MKKILSLFGLLLLVCSANAQALFDSIEDFGIIKKGWAVVYLDNCVGIINKQGEVILPPVFDYIEDFGIYSNKLALISYHGKVGLINRKGKIVTPPNLESIEDFDIMRKGWAKVKNEKGYGF